MVALHQTYLVKTRAIYNLLHTKPKYLGFNHRQSLGFTSIILAWMLERYTHGILACQAGLYSILLYLRTEETGNQMIIFLDNLHNYLYV